MIGGIAVNSLRHAHRKLTKALRRQVGEIIHCSNYYYIPAVRACVQALQRSFADKAFFCNSGAEANEAAIKLARGYFHYKGEDRYEIITAKMSFHGRTLGTISATGQPKFSEPFAPVVPVSSMLNSIISKTFESAVTQRQRRLCWNLSRARAEFILLTKST